MSLEDDLKKQMGYSDDTRQRCPNCTHCQEGEMRAIFCWANKALPFQVSENGRCNLFSAKRQRRVAEVAKAAE